MLGFKVKALDDCGAFPRYEPLGCIIWAQVTPGLYRWRNIRVDFTQVVTNKSPVAPNRGYSRMQQLWLTERICDIVAHELGLDPVEVRKRNYVKTEEMPYETPNGCVYDSGDYARCLDIALELIDYDAASRSAQASRATRQAARRSGSARRSTRGTNNFGQSHADQPGAPVLGQQRGGDGQARHLRRDRAHARHRPAGAGPRDDRLAGRGRHPRRLARPDPRAAGPRLLLELARRLLRARTRASSRSPASRRSRARPRSSSLEISRLAGAVLGGADPDDIVLEGGFAQAQGQPGGGAAVHGLRRDREREQRGAPARRARRHAQLPLRLPCRRSRARLRAEVRQPDADLRDADPRVRGRDRPRDRARRDRRLRGGGRLRRSASTRRSSRARCTARPRTRSAPPCTRPSPTTSTGSS